MTGAWQTGWHPLFNSLGRLCFVAAAAGGCAPGQAVLPARDVRAEAHALLQGLGPARACVADADCAVGQTGGACALGTCFGLLTTDQRPIRRVIAERIGQVDPVLSAQLQTQLLALGSHDTAVGMRLAVVEGLGALLANRKCAEPGLLAGLVAAIADPTPSVAAAARVMLGHCGDETALPGLLEDSREGAELLRLESTAALRGYLARPGAATAKEALLARLLDSSPAVQRAAVTALLAYRADAEVPRALRQLVAGRAPHLRYFVERSLLEPSQP